MTIGGNSQKKVRCSTGEATHRRLRAKGSMEQGTKAAVRAKHISCFTKVVGFTRESWMSCFRLVVVVLCPVSRCNFHTWLSHSFGCGSKLKSWGYAGFGLCFLKRGPKTGITFLSHSHLFALELSGDA